MELKEVVFHESSVTATVYWSVSTKNGTLPGGYCTVLVIAEL